VFTVRSPMADCRVQVTSPLYNRDASARIECLRGALTRVCPPRFLTVFPKAMPMDRAQKRMQCGKRNRRRTRIGFIDAPERPRWTRSANVPTCPPVARGLVTTVRCAARRRARTAYVGRLAEYNTLGEYAGRDPSGSHVTNHPAPAPGGRGARAPYASPTPVPRSSHSRPCGARRASPLPHQRRCPKPASPPDPGRACAQIVTED
jgi:hypothetical protein